MLVITVVFRTLFPYQPSQLLATATSPYGIAAESGYFRVQGAVVYPYFNLKKTHEVNSC